MPDTATFRANDMVFSTIPGTGVAKCCASCEYWCGWFDNMWCGLVLEDNRIRPYVICNNWMPRAGLFFDGRHA